MPSLLSRLYLIRHGETAWSLSGQHTGLTDIPLTEQRERDACKLAERLGAVKFRCVFTSPLKRARRTAELAGLGDIAEIEPDLAEWGYGDYEGQRPVDIRKGRPDGNVFRDGCPRGETPTQVSERADRLIGRWIGLPVGQAQHFLLSTASLSILGYEHSIATEWAIVLRNAVSHLETSLVKRNSRSRVTLVGAAP